MQAIFIKVNNVNVCDSFLVVTGEYSNNYKD